jgi:hypothetical protein
VTPFENGGFPETRQRAGPTKRVRMDAFCPQKEMDDKAVCRDRDLPMSQRAHLYWPAIRPQPVDGHTGEPPWFEQPHDYGFL